MVFQKLINFKKDGSLFSKLSSPVMIQKLFIVTGYEQEKKFTARI